MLYTKMMLLYKNIWERVPPHIWVKFMSLKWELNNFRYITFVNGSYLYLCASPREKEWTYKFLLKEMLKTIIKGFFRILFCTKVSKKYPTKTHLLNCVCQISNVFEIRSKLSCSTAIPIKLFSDELGGLLGFIIYETGGEWILWFFFVMFSLEKNRNVFDINILLIHIVFLKKNFCNSSMYVCLVCM